jgi:DNA-binding response OmpR family regulator
MNADPGAPIAGAEAPVNVLLLIDQPVQARVVTLLLSHIKGRLKARVAPDGESALALLHDWWPHVAVIDMGLSPGELLPRLGYTDPPSAERVPLVALIRRGDLPGELAAFEQGVDDLVTVPFSPDELVARVLAVLRRSAPTAGELRPVVLLGELEVDILSRRLSVGEVKVDLTTDEQNLLYLLAANVGNLLTREEILDHLWGIDYVADSSLVDRHIRHLRAKLQDGWRRPRYIATVSGLGYRFLPKAQLEE